MRAVEKDLYWSETAASPEGEGEDPWFVVAVEERLPSSQPLPFSPADLWYTLLLLSNEVAAERKQGKKVLLVGTGVNLWTTVAAMRILLYNVSFTEACLQRNKWRSGGGGSQEPHPFLAALKHLKGGLGDGTLRQQRDAEAYVRSLLENISSQG